MAMLNDIRWSRRNSRGAFLSDKPQYQPSPTADLAQPSFHFNLAYNAVNSKYA